jgi:pyruvate/2-oxoglutarate dehydrogenase complex dihydrolipoamide dehydrogenase (E3) component
MIIRAANTLAEARRVGKLAGHGTVQPDWSVVAGGSGRTPPTTGTTRSPLSGSAARAAGSSVVATVTGNRTVVVGGQEFRASRGLVLATGTQPAVPPIDGLARAPYWTNHETLEAKEAPASLTVAC